MVFSFSALLLDCFFFSFPLIGDSLLISGGVRSDVEELVAPIQPAYLFCHGH